MGEAELRECRVIQIGWRGAFGVAGLVAGLASASLAHAFVTAGQFAVSETGAATYTIPIQVPPGVGGIEPKLALTYNSQSGNGLMGMGWSLSGLSAITRCPRTQAQDGVRGAVNFDWNDRYCLDGQRLIAIQGSDGGEGTEYRTERDSFSRVVSYGTAGNGPASFKVWTKAGLVMEYGTTADSRIEAQGKSSVMVWAVSKVTDVKGNYYSVGYTEDSTNGAYYPARIDYTANANTGLVNSNSVQFVYESRPDTAPAYWAGSLLQYSKRLQAVRVYAGSLVKEYRLRFDTSSLAFHSRLISIVECQGDGVTCLPEWVIGWKDQGALGYSHVSSAAPGAGWDVNKRWIGDFNGDGKSDLLSYYGEQFTTFLSLGNSTYSMLRKPVSGAGWDSNWVWSGDYNGDGKTDLLSYFGGQFTSFFSLGDGNYATTQTPTLSSGWAANWAWSGDYNGDGKSDLLSFYGGQFTTFFSEGDGRYNPIQTATIGTGWDANWVWPGDYNGDGKTDLLSYYGGQFTTFLSEGNGLYKLVQTPTLSSGWSANWAWSGDYNGDGKTDLLAFYGGQFTTFFSRGDGSYNIVQSAASSAGWDANRVWPGDYNGDGTTDLLSYYGGQFTSFFSKGDGNYATTQIPTESSGWAANWAWSGDYNGDGKSDLLSFYGEQFITFSASASTPYVVATLSSGLGKAIDLSYVALSSSDVYVKGQDSLYPLVDLQPQLYVVASTAASNGQGGTLTTSYKYGGLRAELGTGRGLLGFAWKEAVQSETGVTTRTDYRQDFPFTGLVSRLTTTRAGSGNGGLLNDAVHHYDCTDFDATAGCQPAAGKRYFPFATRVEERTWDLDGVALPIARIDTVYDCTSASTVCYGNATRVTATTLHPDGTPSGYAKTTTSTYYDDPANWYLGRLVRATVTSTAP